NDSAVYQSKSLRYSNDLVNTSFHISLYLTYFGRRPSLKHSASILSAELYLIHPKCVHKKSMSSIAAAEKVVLLFGAKEQDRVERNAGKLLPTKSQSIVSVILV